MSEPTKLPVARVNELPTGEDKAAWLVRPQKT